MKDNTSVLFTILLPTHRGVNLLPYSIASVLAQTIQSFELFIICDGVPVEIAQYAQAYAAQDPRIRVFNCPKGKRFGETHRHHALLQAKGKFVAGIADDDLWFPNHLEELKKLLTNVDFGNLFQTDIDYHGNFYGIPGDLGDARFVKKMLNTKFNFFGPSVCGYRLSAYQKLQEGWAPAPENIWSDLYMWRKFLSTSGLRFGSRLVVTALHFSAVMRRNNSDKEREIELSKWSQKIQCPIERDAISQQVLKLCARDANQIVLLNRFTSKLARLLMR